jgi:hypothetical protein
MSYTDFTLESVETDLGVRVRSEALFPGVTATAVPEWLDHYLERGKQLSLISEKARSEFIVGPILLAVREQSGGSLAVFSGQRLDVDAARGLTGECDFLLALAEAVPRLRAPIVTVVEAKKNDIELGLGQCVAQMVAARQYHEREQTSVPVIHGCVTTGEAWQFLRLEGSAVLLDRSRYYIDNLGAILGVWDTIVSRSALALSTT